MKVAARQNSASREARRMNRRAFVTGLGAAFAAPRAVEAQGLRHVDFRWGDAG